MMLEVIYSLNCFCGEEKLKYQSTCWTCVHKLPPEIKYELWRPLEDGFMEVFKDAVAFIKALGVEVEEILYEEERREL